MIIGKLRVAFFEATLSLPLFKNTNLEDCEKKTLVNSGGFTPISGVFVWEFLYHLSVFINNNAMAEASSPFTGL